MDVVHSIHIQYAFMSGVEHIVNVHTIQRRLNVQQAVLAAARNSIHGSRSQSVTPEYAPRPCRSECRIAQFQEVGAPVAQSSARRLSCHHM